MANAAKNAPRLGQCTSETTYSVEQARAHVKTLSQSERAEHANFHRQAAALELGAAQQAESSGDFRVAENSMAYHRLHIELAAAYQGNRD